MKNNGWIKLSRDLADSHVWINETFSRGQAWVDLLMLTNHADGFIRVAGQRLDIKRGQCGWSLDRLSKRWKWSRGKAERFMKELENDQRITRKTNTRNTIITICKYNDFQGNGKTDSKTDGHQTVKQTDTNKNDNNNKNEKNIDISSAFDMWNRLANQEGLPKAQVLTEKRRKHIGARLKDCGGIDGWNDALAKVSQSSFLTGKKNDFKASLDFIIKQSSFVKLMEGNYDDRPTTGNKNHDELKEWLDEGADTTPW